MLPVRCFHVLVHAKLDWIGATRDAPGPDVRELAGFYCHRYVLASNETEAEQKAFCRVRANLDGQTGWLSDGAARLELEAEEVQVASMGKLVRPDNRGHSFYCKSEGMR